MKRKLKALGLILGVTALIAATYVGFSRLIEKHLANESVGVSVFTTELAKSAY